MEARASADRDIRIGQIRDGKISHNKFGTDSVVSCVCTPGRRKHDIRYSVEIEFKPRRGGSIYDNCFLINQRTVIIAIDRNAEAVVPSCGQVSANKIKRRSTN